MTIIVEPSTDLRQNPGVILFTSGDRQHIQHHIKQLQGTGILNTQQDDSQPRAPGNIYSSGIAQRRWGDQHKDLNDDHISLLFQNINGLTIFATVHAEVQANHIRLQGDLTGMSETNVNWKNYTF